jgi:hypothetical protein
VANPLKVLFKTENNFDQERRIHCNNLCELPRVILYPRSMC